MLFNSLGAKSHALMISRSFIDLRPIRQRSAHRPRSCAMFRVRVRASHSAARSQLMSAGEEIA